MIYFSQPQCRVKLGRPILADLPGLDCVSQACAVLFCQPVTQPLPITNTVLLLFQTKLERKFVMSSAKMCILEYLGDVECCFCERQ